MTLTTGRTRHATVDGQRSIRDRLAAVDLVRAGAWLLGSVAIMGVLGLLNMAVPNGTPLLRPLVRPFDLDVEFGAAALYSALLLGGAGLGWLASGSAADSRTRRLGRAFGALLLFMAVDESFAVHEFIERHTGIDWQLVYLPLVLVGACVVGSLVMRRTMGRTAAALILAGSALWAGSQVLEAVEWDGDVPTTRFDYETLMVLEELGEAAGSVMFLLGSAAAARHVASQTATGDHPHQGHVPLTSTAG